MFARYVLDTPLLWSDELASLLFLWLAMLGAAVAFRRGEHMRMTAFVNRASPSTQAFLNVFAISVSLVFVLLVLGPSFSSVTEQSVITTPAMGISMGWRTAALPTGLVFMTIFALMRLIEVSNWRLVGKALVLMAVIGLALYAMTPLFEDLGNYTLVIFFVVLVAIGVFTGVPIAFSFGIATYAYLSLRTYVPVVVRSGERRVGTVCVRTFRS